MTEILQLKESSTHCYELNKEKKDKNTENVG